MFLCVTSAFFFFIADDVIYFLTVFYFHFLLIYIKRFYHETMHNAIGSDGLGTEQMFVLRMLQLSSHRTALVEQRAKKAGHSFLTKPNPSSSGDEAGLKTVTAPESIVVGPAALPMNGEAAPTDGVDKDYRPHTSAATATAAAVAPLTMDAPPASLASPQLSMSPMRRMLEMKGARPVRRPRVQDVIPPYRRSCGGGLTSCGGGGASGGSGSSSCGSRPDTVKATLPQRQRVVMSRCLSPLGLTASVDSGGAAPQRREVAAGTAVSPTASASVNRHSAFPLEDGVNGEEDEAATPSAHGGGGDDELRRLNGSVTAVKTSLNASRHDRIALPSAVPATVPASAATPPYFSPLPPLSVSLLGAACDGVADSSRHEKPSSFSPDITHSFTSFLQHLCSPAFPVAPASHASNYDTDSDRARPTTTTTTTTYAASPVHALDGDGVGDCWGEHAISPFSADALPPPPPPPLYVETRLLHTNSGAGTFKTAQELVAHVRLAQPWTIVATRRWYRSGDHAKDNSGADSATSLASADLQLMRRQQQHQLPSLMGRKCPSSLSNKSAAAAAVCESPLLDGEATLVSDRVDAILPTWAFLASHTADATPATLASSLVRQPPGLAMNEVAAAAASLLSSASTSHRECRSHNSSLSSSARSSAAALHHWEEWAADERLDRQSLLFPYELAEACAMGRLRRLNGICHRAASTKTKMGSRVGVAAAAEPELKSSLHLLQLECLLDVQQIPPTVRSVSLEERQTMLERALEEFAESGLLPTTVLRSVLNDAALRILSSVDDDVLRRIAGDEVDDVADVDGEKWADTPAASPPAADAATERSAEAVPLSLHVHTVQGGSSASDWAQSAALSTVSGDTESLLTSNATTPPATPTRLIITVLVHVSSWTRHAVTADAEREVQTKASSPETASLTPNNVEEHAMREDTALAVAHAVLPHLFPASFALSRYTTRVAVSSSVRYDALCTASKDTTANGPAATITTTISTGNQSEKQKQQISEEAGPTAATTQPALDPWAWAEVDLAELRTACGVVVAKPKPPLTGIHDAVTVTLADIVTPVPSLPTKSRARWSGKKTARASSSVAAAKLQLEDVATTENAQPLSFSRDPREKTDGGQKHQYPAESMAKEEEEEEEDGDAESVDVAGVSDSQLRWDVAKETAGLTAAVETMQRRLQRICGHAQLLEQFARDLEDAKEDQHGKGKGQKVPKGQESEAPRRRAAGPPSYTEEVKNCAKEVMAQAAMCLVKTLLQEKNTADSNSSSSASLFTTIATPSLLSHWFVPFAAYLAKEVCGPLEQLEALILETTNSVATSPVTATVASVSVMDTSDNMSDGEASNRTRHIVGAQVVLKKTRRQRRAAAVVARHAQAAVAGQKMEGGDVAAEVLPPPSLLPALTLAKTMVQLCCEMTEQTGAPSRRVPLGKNGEGGTAADNDKAAAVVAGAEAAQATFISLYHSSSAHPRSLSTMSAASMRVLGGAGVAQTLQERIASLCTALHRVQGQMTREEHRWAVVPASLQCLQTEWGTLQESIHEEASARQQLQLNCAARRVKTEHALRARLAEEAATTTATAAEAAKTKEMVNAKALKNAASAVTQSTAHVIATLRARLHSTTPVVDVSDESKTERTSHKPAGGGDNKRADVLETQRARESRDTTTAVAPDAPSVQAASLPLSPPSPALDAAFSTSTEDTAEARTNAVRKTETITNDNARPTAPAPESTPQMKVTKRAGPQLSIHTANTSSPRIPRHPTSSASTATTQNNNNNKDNSSKNGNTTMNGPKKLRNRNKNRAQQQQQPSPAHSSTARTSAASSPIANSSASMRSVTSPSPSGSRSPPAAGAGSAAANTTPTTTADKSGDSSFNGAAPVVRPAPQTALQRAFQLHFDFALIRQAAPFIVLGTLLLLFFLLL